MKPYSLLLVLLFVGCGSSDDEEGLSDTPGPSGGMNTFEALEDGIPTDFDAVQVKVVPTSTIVTLTLSGSVDPVANLVDDEFSLNLVLDLDREALASLDAPVTLNVDGTTSFAGSISEPVAFSWTGAPPILVRAYFYRLCFCAPTGTGQHDITGTLTFDSASATEIAGTLSLTVTGTIPYTMQTSTYTLNGTFNRAIP